MVKNGDTDQEATQDEVDEELHKLRNLGRDLYRLAIRHAYIEAGMVKPTAIKSGPPSL